MTGFLALGFAVYFFGSQYLKLKAFDDCAKASSYTYENAITAEQGSVQKTTVTEPKHEFYYACLLDKGYKTSIAK